MRNSPSTRNPNSRLQQFNKGTITSIQNAWVAMTQAERDVWGQYAIYRNIKQKKNANKTISGQQVFIRENQLRVSLNGFGNIYAKPIHTAPIFTQPPIVITCTGISISSDPPSIFYNVNIDKDIQGIILKLSQPLRESQQSRYTKRKLMKFNTISGTTQNFPNYYQTVYGLLPIVGQFLSVEIGIYDSVIGTYSLNNPQLIEVT